MITAPALLTVHNVSKSYAAGDAAWPAVNDVSLSIHSGTVTGIVGESGSGKTTLARIMAGLLRPSAGEVTFAGTALGTLGTGALRRLRAHLQYVHQDPAAALNPRLRVRDILHEPLRIHTQLPRGERQSRISRLMEAVGLSAAMLDRFPHQLSGGQQRRVGLARILVLEPRLVILDEPTAGLDLLVQAALLALLRELRDRLALTYVVVTHDLAVVEALCDEMVTMFRGCAVEQGATARVLMAPVHPYTRELLSAMPTLGGPRVIDQERWQTVSPETIPLRTGCAFVGRCDVAMEQCQNERPALRWHADRAVACWAATNSTRRSLVKLITTFVAASMLVLAPSFAFAQVPPDHPITDKLHVAAEVGFAPFNFRDAEGTVQGFEVDMNAEIAKRLGRPGIEVVDVVWSNIFAAMAAKRVEYIIGPMTITPQRANEMLFGQPYFDVALAFLTKAGAPMKTIEDFKGTAVGVTSGSVQDDWMRDNGAKYGIDVSRFDKTADAVQAVGIGRLAAYMTTAPSALWMVKTQKAFSANVIVPTGGYFALPFRKDDAAFRDMVDDNLKCMKQDGTLAKIYEKWFGVAPTAASAIVKVFPGHGAQGWPGYIANAPEPKCF